MTAVEILTTIGTAISALAAIGAAVFAYPLWKGSRLPRAVIRIDRPRNRPDAPATLMVGFTIRDPVDNGNLPLEARVGISLDDRWHVERTNAVHHFHTMKDPWTVEVRGVAAWKTPEDERWQAIRYPGNRRVRRGLAERLGPDPDALYKAVHKRDPTSLRPIRAGDRIEAPASGNSGGD